MGLALLHGEVLPGAHFTPNFLKGLLGQPSQLGDLRGNPPVQKFLKQLQAGDFRCGVISVVSHHFVPHGSCPEHSSVV